MGRFMLFIYLLCYFAVGFAVTALAVLFRFSTINEYIHIAKAISASASPIKKQAVASFTILNDKNTAPIINSKASVNVNNSLFFILCLLFFSFVPVPLLIQVNYFAGFFTGFPVGFAGFAGFAFTVLTGQQPGQSQQSPHPILTSF
jgi:hypothetical protein